MATNTFITPSWVTKDTATNFKNNLKLVGQFDRQYDDQYRQAGAKMGYTVNARLPERFIVTEGQAYEQQPILNQVVPITINHQYKTGIGWSTADATMVVEEVQKRYTVPCGIAIANRWDKQAGAEVVNSMYFAIGTPGQPIADNQTWTDGVALLQNAGVPTDELVGVLHPKAQSKLVSTNQALFQPRNDYFKKAIFGTEALGVSEWQWDQNMPMFTTGTFTASTPAIAGANQTGSSLAIDGMGTYAFVVGDRFTIAGVNMVNPQSYIDSGELQQFVVTAALSGSSTATLSISPAIITSGPLQTVTNSPANDAAVAFIGATGTVGATMAATKSKMSMIFHPNAFAFVMADLDENLPGATAKRISSPIAGISIRFVQQYNGLTDQKINRMDTIGGIAPVLPYFGLVAYS